MFDTMEQNKNETKRLERMVADNLSIYFRRNVAKQQRAAQVLGYSPSLFAKMITDGTELAPISLGKALRLYQLELVPLDFFAGCFLEFGVSVLSIEDDGDALGCVGYGSHVFGDAVERGLDGRWCHQDSHALFPKFERLGRWALAVAAKFKRKRNGETPVINPNVRAAE